MTKLTSWLVCTRASIRRSASAFVAPRLGRFARHQKNLCEQLHERGVRRRPAVAAERARGAIGAEQLYDFRALGPAAFAVAGVKTGLHSPPAPLTLTAGESVLDSIEHARPPAN